MTIASFSFLAFAFIVILAYNLRAGVTWRKIILLLANALFISTFTHSLEALLPLLLFVGAGYLSVKAMQRAHRQSAYVLIICGTILAFIWLKKYSFLPHGTFLNFAYTVLGLSFIFFRVLHMIIDVHQDSLGAPVTLISYLNYTFNFTTLVSGPIQNYPQFIEQHLPAERPPLTIVEMGNGLERIIVGFFKVNVAALVLSMVQNSAIDTLSAAQSLRMRALTGAIIAASYPVYLYFNFSGYTDIVIGIARFLRIRLPENFNRPFSTDNFLEFWNHWHMTLSGWLKKYVYNALLIALLRRFPSKGADLASGVFAFFVTFFLIGIWHGRTSEFLFYGLLLAVGVSLNKLYQVKMAKALGKKRYKALANHWMYQSICRGLNFTFFAFYLLWFWSTWTDLGRMSKALQPAGQLVAWGLIFIVSTVVLALWQVVRDKAFSITWESEPLLLSRYFRTVWNTCLLTVVIAVMELLSSPAPDIVYKAF